MIEPIVEKPEAVLFDWAGVLVYDAFKILANIDPDQEEYGLLRGAIDTAKEYFWPRLCTGEITEDQFWNSVTDRIGPTGQVPSSGSETVSVTEYIQDVRKKLIDAHKPYPFMFDLVDMYKKEGVLVGLATNNCKEWLEIWEEQYRLSEMFKPIVASCYIGRKKPEPAFYLEARRALREDYGIRDMSRVLVYDDQERNVEAANNAGFRGILFRP